MLHKAHRVNVIQLIKKGGERMLQETQFLPLFQTDLNLSMDNYSIGLVLNSYFITITTRNQHQTNTNPK